MQSPLRSTVKVAKVDAELGIVFGWAIVCKRGGEDYHDLQGHHIPEGVMAAAVTEFMKDSRVAKEMHAGGERGRVVHSMIVTEATTGSAGITADQTGWYVGASPDPELLAKFKSGEVSEYSIGGEGVLEDVAKSIAKGDTAAAGPPRKTITELRIDELSFVDKGAQEPGYAPIAKRGDGITGKGAISTYIVKGDGILTTEVDGHVHLIDDGCQAGMSSYSETSTGAGHCHPYVITDAGVITIGASYGHTHEINAATVEPDDTATAKRHDPKETNMDPTALRKALSELTDAQLSHYRSLSTVEAQEAFLSKAADQRESIAKAAREADQVVYTATDGTVVRKSMDPSGLLVKAMKDADEARAATAIEKAARERVELEKRAEPLTKNLPGKLSQRAALVKAIESIVDEADKTAALAMLKAGNDAAGKAFEMNGHGGGDVAEGSAEAQLKKLAAERADKEKCSIAKATTWLLDNSAEYRDLKKQADRERTARARA